MRKFLILDTSVLLYDKHSIHSFPGNDIVLPVTVLDELDRFKDKQNLLGDAARYVNRFLDDLRKVGRLDKGVRLPDADQTVRILTQPELEGARSVGLDVSRGDNRIISVALSLKAQNKRKPVKVITKDINLRVKCDSLGLTAEDYYKDHVEAWSEAEELGTATLDLSDERVDNIFSGSGERLTPEEAEGLFENCFVVCKSPSNKSALGYYKRGYVKQLKPISLGKTINVSPRNKEQAFALHALTDHSSVLVTLTGIAGSGKTFLTLMAGLDGLYTGKYERIIITRSIQPVGKDIGFLPGDVKEKMDPWMAPIADNFRHAFKDMTYFETMMQKGQIDIAPLSFIRGRTFNNAFIIVDEAQNTTIHELKTIITRVGRDSKIVLLGDIDQVDTPYIDKRSNGLSIVIDKLRDSDITSHCHLCKGERSDIATLASRSL